MLLEGIPIDLLVLITSCFNLSVIFFLCIGLFKLNKVKSYLENMIGEITDSKDSATDDNLIVKKNTPIGKLRFVIYFNTALLVLFISLFICVPIYYYYCNYHSNQPSSTQQSTSGGVISPTESKNNNSPTHLDIDFSEVVDAISSLRETSPTHTAKQAIWLYAFGIGIVVVFLGIIAWILYSQLMDGRSSQIHTKRSAWAQIAAAGIAFVSLSVSVVLLIMECTDDKTHQLILNDNQIAKLKPDIKIDNVTSMVDRVPFLLANHIGPFRDASSEAQEGVNIKDQICCARMILSNHKSPYAIVVGRHDRRNLTAKAVALVGSNTGIAQMRAEAVASKLSDPVYCKEPAITNIITAIGGPKNIYKTDTKSKNYIKGNANDRIVEIYGFKLLKK